MNVGAWKRVGQSVLIVVIGIPALLVAIAFVGWILTLLWTAFFGPAPNL